MVQPGAHGVNQADIGGSHTDDLRGHLLIAGMERQDVRKDGSIQHTEELRSAGDEGRKVGKVRNWLPGATYRRNQEYIRYDFLSGGHHNGASTGNLKIIGID